MSHEQPTIPNIQSSIQAESPTSSDAWRGKHELKRLLFLQELTGLNRLNVAMNAAFNAEGFETHWVTVRPPGPLHEMLGAAGIPAYSLRCERARDYPIGAARLGMMARRLGAHVIFAVEPISATIAGLSSVLNPAPVVLYSRQHVLAESRTQRFLSRVASGMANCTVPVSRAGAEAAQRDDLVPASRLRVVYSGIPPLRAVTDAEKAAIRRHLGIEDMVIGIVARLRPEKGHLTLISAVAKAARRLSRPLHLVIVGSGPFEQQLKKSAEDAAPARVHFAGHQDDVAPWYAISDIVCSPSYREAFGLSTAEAMSAACPVIASAVGGLLEVIEDGVSGILVPAKDDAALADAIVQVASNAALAKKLGEGAHRRFEKHFRVESAMHALCNVFREMLDRKAAGW